MSQNPEEDPGQGMESGAPAAAADGQSRATPTTGLKLVTISPASGTSSRAPLPSRSSEGGSPGADPLLGCTVDNRYLVEAVLGEGGMGVVYRCRHKIIDKRVAMKVLRADLARDAEVTERFLIEAKAASSIGDEHIIDISDFGQLPDGSTYFVMEYLDGFPLSTVIDAGSPAPVPRILHISRQLADGLDAAHRAGIVHRDLKPDNIFLVQRGQEKDFVKILDFGIAKVSTGTTGKLTRAGSVFGTPHYMSPEQAAGAPVDHRGDIYSFGVILYELASGQVPFDADNFMGILTQHMYKAPVPIRALVPAPQDIPPGLEAIILKCLSKRPEQRYQSMGELAEELDKLKAGLVPEAVPEMMARSGSFNVPTDFFKGQGKMPAPVPATPAGIARNRWPLYAGIAGVVAAVSIVTAILVQSGASTASEPEPTAGIQPAPAAELEPAPPDTAPVEEEKVTTHPVALAVEPMDAEVFRGDENLGTSPVVLGVPEGESVSLKIRREGYVTRELTVDGSESKLTVRLDREKSVKPATVRPASRPKAPAATPSRSTTPKPKPAQSSKAVLGGGEIVNPWER